MTGNGKERENPWENIKLSDYESHMRLDSVMQLQVMNHMMRKQFNDYPIETAMVLGIAGGNGLEHINPKRVRKIYGIDINPNYLEECIERYENLKGILECFCMDLTEKNINLPYADMVIANLLIEYIGYNCFQSIISQMKPMYISSVIQVNKENGFVSNSCYISVFDNLSRIHNEIEENELTAIIQNIGYDLIKREEQELPNQKKLIQLDFRQSITISI